MIVTAMATATGTAVLAFALAASPSPVEVQGQSRCPTATEVASVLSELLPGGEAPYPDVAFIEAVGVDLQIELRGPTGEVQASRRIVSRGTCAELAVIAAVVIASWTAERNPGISLLQPGVLAAPKPMAPPALPSAPAPTMGRVTAPPATQQSSRQYDLAAGLGGSVNSAGAVGAARVEAGMRGRRLGLRAGFAAETARSEAIDRGIVSWRRYGLSLGPTLTLVEHRVRLDVRAEIFAGLTTVSGERFDVNRQSSAAAAGVAAALRLETASGWIRPWIEVGAQDWLANQEITVAREQGTRSRVSLPSWEGRLFAGISLVLSR
jgi:hypothetical protein